MAKNNYNQNTEVKQRLKPDEQKEIMTNKEISDALKKLIDAQSTGEITGNEAFQEQMNSIHSLIKDVGLYLPHTLENSVQQKVYNMSSGLHNFLQSNMMLNACISAEDSSDLAKEACKSAKWSCFWAAVAAIAACISIIVMWCLS